MDLTQIKTLSRTLDFNRIPSFICDSKLNIVFVNKFIVDKNVPIKIGCNLSDIFNELTYDLESALRSLNKGLPFYSTNFEFNQQKTVIHFIGIANSKSDAFEYIMCSLVDPDELAFAAISSYIDKINGKNRQHISSIVNMIAPVALRLQELEQYDMLDYINDISHSCYDMLKTNSNFSLYQRLVNAREELSSAPVVLNDIIVELCTSLQVLFSKSGYIINTDLTKTKITTMLDEEKFLLILINIISNSCKFSPNNSMIKLSLSVQGSNFNVSITDEGIGISPENLSQVFTPFFVDDDNFEDKGVGLGLPIAKLLVELHQGTIMINSAVGKGTTVGISLPINNSITKNLTFENSKNNYIINRFSPLYINFAHLCDIKLF